VEALRALSVNVGDVEDRRPTLLPNLKRSMSIKALSLFVTEHYPCAAKLKRFFKLLYALLHSIIP
jgi:hypothetical protein